MVYQTGPSIFPKRTLLEAGGTTLADCEDGGFHQWENHMGNPPKWSLYWKIPWKRCSKGWFGVTSICGSHRYRVNSLLGIQNLSTISNLMLAGWWSGVEDLDSWDALMKRCLCGFFVLSVILQLLRHASTNQGREAYLEVVDPNAPWCAMLRRFFVGESWWVTWVSTFLSEGKGTKARKFAGNLKTQMWP